MGTNQHIDDEMNSRLAPGENVLLVSRFRLPKVHTEAASFFMIIVFVRLFDEFRNLVILKRLRRQSRDLSFPLDRRMIVCVTEQRILLWRSRFRTRSLNYLGDVPRVRVRSVRDPYVSNGKWKLMTLETREGHSIQLYIDSGSSDALSRLLSTVLNAAVDS